MNRKRYILFLIFFLIFPVFSLLAAAEKLLLWEAVHPEKAGKLFLAGSIHLGKKELFPLDRRYDEVLAKSDEMVFEVYDKDPSVTQKTAMEFIRKKAFVTSFTFSLDEANTITRSGVWSLKRD